MTVRQQNHAFWKNGKSWAYSITYDEGCRDLLKYALPLHRKYGLPGHVAVVASQIGVPRDVPGSHYNGMMILSKQEIDDLCAEGWGVSCHGMTHQRITDSNARYEVIAARQHLEQRLERKISVFCVPNDNKSYQPTLNVAKEAGLSAIMTIYDDINTQRADLFRLHRCPLHSEFPAPFYSAFDPYKRIHQAIDAGGWIIDYCHCPVPNKPICPSTDCTLGQLEERFKTIRRIGGDDVWLAEPTEIVSFLQTRK